MITVKVSEDLKTILYTADEKPIISLDEENRKYIRHIKPYHE